ncbi:hypothetical protein [Tenacibaculum jejuense]|uniref:Lipoprotein n=1 Tax=Tenacibaculum jejuense TaxID=584609 RepID=A0A238U8K1_9FLAO|nr:hypothetical protein [Tenacibaculum jejuense]SNR15487.1 protein of unknown function [Tenacibaculum jejuense]
MKKLFYLSLVFVLISCSKVIKKEDLQGVWICNYKAHSNSFFHEIYFKNDSITLIDFFDYSFKGKYEIQGDSLRIYLKNKTLKKKIDLQQNDSIVILNNSTFLRHSNIIENEYITYNLINLDSNIKIHYDSLSTNHKTFNLIKRENKFILEDYSGFDNLNLKLYNYPVHTIFITYNILLNREITLRQLKNILSKINLTSHCKINLITKIDLQKELYHVFPLIINSWEEDLKKLQKENKELYHVFPLIINSWEEDLKKLQKENNGFPPRPPITEDENKASYIEAYHPELLQIKSKQDFDKIQHIKPNSHYLISINIELPVQEYLKLTQKLNFIRKDKNTRIRTELINF